MDLTKDQSYFLSLLDSSQLDKIILPLAGYTKTKVKLLAKQNHLIPTTPGESQDICFINDTGFSQFIIKKNGIVPTPGPIKDIHGIIVGTHKGLHAYTIGQRRGLNCPASQAYYVRHIDLATNTLVVCFKQDLAQTKMQVENIIWNYSDTPEESTLTTKIRYSHKGAASHLLRNGSTGQVTFDDPQLAITPGQTAVFYQGNRVLGAGIIQ